MQKVRGYVIILVLKRKHVAEPQPAGSAVKQMMISGERLCKVGSPPTNGNWPPHVHFEIIMDMLGRDGEFPGMYLFISILPISITIY